MYDGTGDTIAFIRNERKLTRKQAAARGGTRGDQWGKWEKGQKPSLKQWEKILKGLDCTEMGFWEQKVSLEEEHYRKFAVEQGLPTPTQTSLVLAGKLDWLKHLDIREYPQEQRAILRQFHLAALGLTQILDSLFGNVENLYFYWKEKGTNRTP